jgi:hypothetical protein
METRMRAPLRTLALLAVLATAGAAQARIEPDMYKMGQSLCANLSDEYAGAYITASGHDKAQTAELFQDVKTVQDAQTAEAANRGAGAVEVFQTSLAHFVQRTALLMAMEERKLGSLAAREELYNQCNARLEPLRDTPQA